MSGQSEARERARARRAARKLLTQALYQLEIGGHPWQDVHRQFVDDPTFAGADPAYFKEVLMRVAEDRAALDGRLSRYADIAPERLDPVEHAILLVGLYELVARPDVPYRVAISEAVELARRYGATDGYKFVNGVLDRAARDLRAAEYGREA